MRDKKQYNDFRKTSQSLFQNNTMFPEKVQRIYRPIKNSIFSSRNIISVPPDNALLHNEVPYEAYE